MQPKNYIECTNPNQVCSILIVLTSVDISALMASKHKIFKAEQCFFLICPDIPGISRNTLIFRKMIAHVRCL